MELVLGASGAMAGILAGELAYRLADCMADLLANDCADCEMDEQGKKNNRLKTKTI